MLRPLLLAGLLLSQPALAEKTSSETDLFEVTDRNLVVVRFDAGKDDVSDGERTKLIHAVNQAKDAGQIKGILVAAWSDEEYPRSRAETLTRDDEHLAKGRADHLKKVLQAAKAPGRIRTFSMALYPSWLARIFRTDEAKLKQAVPNGIAGKTRDDLAFEYYGKMLRDKGGPLTAVVIIREQEDALAH